VARELYGWSPGHYSISASNRDSELVYTLAGYVKLRKRMYKMAKKFGILGGEAVFHVYRYSKKTKLWRFGPHWHIIGFGYLEGVSRKHRDSGWVCVDMGDRKTKDDVFKTIRYELSHLGIAQQVNGRGVVSSITWFGDCSYNKGLQVLVSKHAHCPHCGAELTLIQWFGEGDHPCACLEEGQYLLNPPGWDYADNYHGLGEVM
jgi:hypothetical protein